MKKTLLLILLLFACLSPIAANTMDVHQYSQLAQAQAEVEEVSFTITHMEIQGTGRYANLVLTGKHDTYGNIAIY